MLADNSTLLESMGIISEGHLFVPSDTAISFVLECVP